MKETMIMNLGAMAFGGIAISVACKVTKSAWPLLAFVLIPRWAWSSSNNASTTGNKEIDQNE